ncbi:unnamed protein product, partial [Mesorhabditis spiculigera]
MRRLPSLTLASNSGRLRQAFRPRSTLARLSTGLNQNSRKNPLICNSTQECPLPAVGLRQLSTGSLPAHIKVPLPALSPTMESGTLIAWHKKVGDSIAEGDLLCEIETDKATMGFETPEEGFMAKILIEAGTKDIPIGKLCCIIVQEKADIAAFDSFTDSGAAEKPKAEPTKAARPQESAKPQTTSAAPKAHAAFENPDLMGPAVRLLLHQYHIKEDGIKRSGPKGNILKSDVLDFISAKKLKPAPIQHSAPKSGDKAAAPSKPIGSVRHVEKFVDIPLTNIRSVIAKRLLQSKQTIPHEYLSADILSDKVTKLRQDLKAKGIKVSINDFLVKGCALALKAVPEVNVQWKDQTSHLMQNVDVSVAVATPTGLITPIVFGADSLGILAISEKIRELAKKAKENKLALNEFQGGTFT